jgi:hypothetical protein
MFICKLDRFINVFRVFLHFLLPCDRGRIQTLNLRIIITLLKNEHKESWTTAYLSVMSVIKPIQPYFKGGTVSARNSLQFIFDCQLTLQMAIYYDNCSLKVQRISGAVLTTLHFLHNSRMRLISWSVYSLKAF